MTSQLGKAETINEFIFTTDEHTLLLPKRGHRRMHTEGFKID